MNQLLVCGPRFFLELLPCCWRILQTSVNGTELIVIIAVLLFITRVLHSANWLVVYGVRATVESNNHASSSSLLSLLSLLCRVFAPSCRASSVLSFGCFSSFGSDVNFC